MALQQRERVRVGRGDEPLDLALDQRLRLGAYFVLYPNSRVPTLVLWFPIRIPAWFFLGAWFLYQLVEANFGLFAAKANGGGVAFSANVGGFIFGVLVVMFLAGVGRIATQSGSAISRVPA